MVLDLKGGASYAKNITVEAGSSGVRITATPSVSPELPPIDPNKYTVVLDAGHDGKTLGAVYPDANGVDIYEKDLTLSMVYKLRDILLNEGYNVVLTRDGETAGDLYERSELANRVNADLFVSIHCNSAPTRPPPSRGSIPITTPPAAGARPLPRPCRTPPARPAAR